MRPFVDAAALAAQLHAIVASSPTATAAWARSGGGSLLLARTHKDPAAAASRRTLQSFSYAAAEAEGEWAAHEWTT